LSSFFLILIEQEIDGKFLYEWLPYTCVHIEEIKTQVCIRVDVDGLVLLALVNGKWRTI